MKSRTPGTELSTMTSWSMSTTRSYVGFPVWRHSPFSEVQENVADRNNAAEVELKNKLIMLEADLKEEQETMFAIK